MHTLILLYTVVRVATELFLVHAHWKRIVYLQDSNI